KISAMSDSRSKSRGRKAAPRQRAAGETGDERTKPARKSVPPPPSASAGSGRKRAAKASRSRGTVKTAGGKRATPQLLKQAEEAARDYLRERTEEGHRKAGRVPPSAEASGNGVTKLPVSPRTIIDQSIRDYIPPR